MEEAIRSILRASGGLTAFVPASRINWGEHPQGEASPYITMMVVSELDGMHMQGPDRISDARVQIDCYAPTYGAAKQISRAVIDVLHGLRSGNLRLARHTATRDSREGGTNEAERLFRTGLDFNVNWRA